jgi:DNA-binding CsgD family transcriptional regulator
MKPKMDLEVRPKMTVSKEDMENFGKLTIAEKQVLRWIAAGKYFSEIADRLGISDATVKTHRQNIERKLNRHNIADITAIWMQLGHAEDENFTDGAGI